MATTDETERDEDIAGDEGAEGKAAPSRWRLSRNLILVAIGAVIALGALGAGGYHFLSARSAAAAAKATKPVVFLDMPDVLVNLSAAGGERTQYLKVKVTLELPDQAMEEQIKPVMPRLQDAFQTYLRELRPTDLDGSAGLYRLKEELTRRVNAAIAPSRINAVLFKEIVVQ